MRGRVAGLAAAVALTARRAATALLLALAIDLAAGEPTARLHPVVWIGSAINRLTRRVPRGSAASFAYGTALAFGVPLTAGACAALAETVSTGLPAPIDVAALALALKPAFALRELLAAGGRVEAALAADDLDSARRAVRALVSRPVEGLDAGLVAAAAIESLAENLGDGFAGPLLAYTAAGLPGAWAYRALNTLDSMVGYREERFEWLGKASARLDDAANILPARLAVLALVAAAPIVGGSPRCALTVARRDQCITASPNAGWPMAAAAGALGLRLEKRGHYILNPGGRVPRARDVRRAQVLVAAAAVLMAVGTLASIAAGSDIRGARRRKDDRARG